MGVFSPGEREVFESIADSLRKIANPPVVVKPERSRRRIRGYERCSFCGKDKRSVEKLIAGPGVWICDACTNLAYEILQDTADDNPPKDADVVELP